MRSAEHAPSRLRQAPHLTSSPEWYSLKMCGRQSEKVECKGTAMVPEAIAVREAVPLTQGLTGLLVPLRGLPRCNEIDNMLRPVLQAGREEVHAAIEKVLTGWPGRKRGELWSRLRQLRNDGRQMRSRRAVWDEEDIEILRTHYSQGRAGACRAVKDLLARHPDWSRQLIWYKAKRLGLSTRPEKPRPWTQDEQGYLLWNAGEKSAARIARKLGRSVESVWHRLSSLGASCKVRIPKGYNLHRVSKLLGVSDAATRSWFRKGLFGEPARQRKNRGRSQSGPRLSLETVIAFCVKHPDKVNREHCDPELLSLLEDKNVRLPGWHGSRQHSVQKRSCPWCGRVIRGNAYFGHVKRCPAGAASAHETKTESAVAN